MSTFHLTISTPDGLLFDGEVQRVRARMIDGDVCLLAHHENYVSAVGAGEAALVTADGQTRTAACIGGMLTVLGGRVRLIATTWEWAEEIDADRAERSRQRAEAKLKETGLDERELQLARARLHRALVRKSVARR